jgi:prepilin-type N-terminal cleavage/methylation domain-containing protein
MFFLQRKNNNKNGFTLIELLVVIAVIGLLSVLAIVALGSANRKARDAKRLADLQRLQTSLQFYFTQHNNFPGGTNVILGSSSAACLNASGWQPTGCTNPYLSQVPADPKEGQYLYTSATSSYFINASLEGAMDNYQGKVRVTANGIQSL